MAEPVDEENQKQAANNGCNIFSIEVEGTTAVVDFETTENAELVVAVYDESGVEMLASGSVYVYAGENTAAVDIETSALPQYFYLRGFLIEPNSFRSICTAYESPDYTKDMQDFFATTTEDYDSNRVLNFDTEKETNFAVYSEETVLIETDDANVNQVTVLDEENQIYRIEHADETVLALVEGDIFSGALEDGTVLVVKVGEVSVDGTTVTVTGAEDVDIAEVFSYVKIEENLGMEDVDVDDSSCEEGVVYNGLVEDIETPDSSGRAVPYAGTTETKTMDYTILDKKLGSGNATASINGSLNLRFDNTFEYYLTLSNTSISLKMNYSGTLTVDISGHASGTLTIGTLRFSALGILNLSFTPKMLFETNAKLNVTGKLFGTVGFSCSVQEGMKNLTTSPTFQASLTAEADIYVGMELKPVINLVSDHLAEASMTATVGGLVTGKMAMSTVSDTTVKHDCSACVDGDIFGKYSASFQVKLLDKDWLTYTYNAADQTVKVMDFYYSADKREGGFTSCPYKKYLVTVTVKDTAGIPVSGAVVNGVSTDMNGQAALYLANGSQTISVSKNGYGTTKNILIDESAQSVSLTLSGQAGTGGSGDFDSSNQGEIQQISLGTSHSSALTKDGALYTWGYNYYGQLGNGSSGSNSSPYKIYDNVLMPGLLENKQKRVSLGSEHSGAIIKDGSLYTWGKNDDGQLGDGTTTRKSTPIQIIGNAAEVSLGVYHSAVITKDGGLYTWGKNDDGQLGDGTTGNKNRPVKIMENVVEVSMGGSHSAALTKDGSLYTWGYNGSGQLGDGTTTNRRIPVKVATNIAHISMGGSHSAALTKDGSLYTWGLNYYGQLGDGTTGNKNRPVKIMENVVEVSMGGSHSAALTKDGSLYTWGRNYFGQLGDGTTSDKRTPTKIFVGENAPSLHLLEDTYYSIASYASNSERAAGEKTVRYTDLKPNETYTFYSMKYKGDGHPLSSSNLLYVTQVRTDTNGSVTLRYTPDENYATPTDFVVSMSRTDVSGAELTMSELSYTGHNQYMNPLLIYNEQRLVEGKDYELTGAYQANAVGEYSFTITGIGAFTGSKTVSYEIGKKDCKTLDIDEIAPVTFDGSAVTPELTVKNGDIILEEGIDYTISYQNNNGAGIGMAIVNGIGNYGGKQVCLFDIAPCTLTEDMLVQIPDQEYTGAPIEPLPLREDFIIGKDYRVEYTNNIEEGTAEVTVIGIGSYTGQLSTGFTIIPKEETIPEKKDIRDMEIEDIAPCMYNGAALTPEVTVKDDGVPLEKGRDYMVSYQNNTDAGTGIAVITGMGGYEGRQISLFEIKPRELTESMLSAIPDQEYTGRPIRPEVLLKDMTDGIDYRVVYTNNTEEGTAEVTVTGVRNYTGTLTASFTILPKQTENIPPQEPEPENDCRNLSVDEIEPFTFDGKAKKPELVVKNGEIVLKKDKDYTVSYRNNVNAGIGIAVIDGKGEYKGRQICLFEIKPCNLTEDMLSEIPDQEYTGKPLMPEILLEDLIEGVDYLVEYSSNIEEGAADVAITGIGNYTGVLSTGFRIVPKKAEDIPPQKKDARSLEIAAIMPLTFNGKAQTPKLEVKDEEKILEEAEDYDVSYRNNINAGTGIAVITGKGEYEGRQVCMFEIRPNQLTADMLSKIPDQIYTGKPLTPKVTLKNMLLGIDYRVQYSNNVKTGIAKVTITGIGNYTGVLSAKFTIAAKKPQNTSGSEGQNDSIVKPKKVNITSLKISGRKKLKVKWQVSDDADGYEIQYGLKKTFKSGVKKLKIKKGGKTSAVLKKLNIGKRYYVRVCAYKTVQLNGKKQKIFGEWSKPKRSGKVK